MPLTTTRRDEQALGVLYAIADDDGYVECTGRVLAVHLDVSPATAARVLNRLERARAVRVVIRGDRTGPSRYRVLRAPLADALRVVPNLPTTPAA